MSFSQSLFDRPILTFRRQRADRAALFLHESVRDDVEDRMALVNREFTNGAIITPFPEIWHDFHPNFKIVADEDVLDLAPEAHDVVIHAMAMHWAEDPVGQIIQCRRALRPDGLFLAASLGGQTLAELRVALAQAESEITGGLSPRIAPMTELRDIGGLLQRAGLALPVADSLPLNVEYSDAFALMRDLRGMGETNCLTARIKHPTRRDVMMRAAQIYAEHFTTDTGRVRATFDMLYLTGWSPDDSQPKPLRPGSATTRLAEALNTSETSLPD